MHSNPNSSVQGSFVQQNEDVAKNPLTKIPLTKSPGESNTAQGVLL